MNAISTTSMHNMSHTSHYPELSAFSTHINEKSFLKGSIQQKFLVICLILIILMAASISAVYWELARRDKQQESQRRIQVAFDILLHEIVTYSETFVQGANDFLEDSLPIREATYMYYDLMGLHDAYDIVRQVAREYLVDVTTDLEKFAHIVAVHRLVLYGPDVSIMAMYQQQDGQEIMGLSTISDAGNQTFLVLDNQEEAAQMLAGERPIPDQLFPLGVQTHFFDQIPEAASVKFFTEDQKLGLRITAPVYHEKEIVGVLVGDIFLTQKWIQQFAALSTTEINLFVGDHLSIGTFPAQEEPDPQATQTLTPHTAAELMKLPSTAHPIEVMSITVEEQEYYHAAYGLVDDHEIVSTIAISVSKATEKQEIRKVLGTILTISGVALVVAIVVSFVLSRRTMKAIDHLVHVIGAAASGNLKRTAPVMSRDEFGLLAVNLNAMIMRLRDVSTQTQAVAHTVTTTADNILGEVDSLFGLMEQQSSAVDNTVGAVERIDQFIDRVVADITELLDGTERILQSLQQMSMNTEAVANSTGYLNQDLHDISNFADQVSRASRQILAHADNLMTTIEETEAATHQINELLVEVAQNAEQSQEFAKETATAALEGQTSVDAAIEGIEALKEVVAQSAQIMQDVNKQSEQVSSILDIVDEITDKTTLLSLNASIISAQAGEHGRGFAVVADEIRELAEQTRSSTHEIGALITTLQRQAAQGVKSVMRGIEKADDGVRLSRDVKEALARINRWAARSLERSKHTVQVIQGTVTGSQAIHASMNKVTEMTAHIRSEIEQEERDLTQVVTSIENIQAMSTQVKHANIEQNAGAMEIETQMQVFTEKLTAISEQARLLQENSDQIVAAMRKLGGITESILQNTTTMSDHTVRSLVHQSDALREGLNVFKVA